ncbi:MAG TPA: 2-oxoglutarate and iron-dependent oxygenase domain-containing protein, partial [Wenzhouxiangella sp.]|nr:2-oxoglutarate and iron-dependent oxygenase domain-containing protein [Wenzhouxiangella sp.]
MTAYATGIPVLSLADFDGHRGGFSRRLGQAWREFGFVGITDHGIDQAVIDGAYDAFREFFALLEATKLRYHQPGKGGARGYTGFGVEHAKGREVPDLKEFWHVGREIPDQGNPHPAILMPNLWPAEVPGFRDRALEVYRALEQLGDRV